MNVPPLPKSWLIHEIKYREKLKGKDPYGNFRYDEPMTINYVRFDDSTVFSRDSVDTKIIANAVIFVDFKNSENVPSKFIEESKIIFNDREYTLKKAIDCYHPTKNEIHHWELEVI